MSKVVTPDPKSGKSPNKEKKFQTLEKVPQTIQSLEQRLVVLNYGSRNNYLKWTEAMTHYLGQKYGVLASVIKTGNFHVEPVPVKTLPSTSQSLSQAEQDAMVNILYTEDLKIWRRKTNDNEQKYIEMYSIIWCYISTESQLQVQEHADWNDIEDARDSARLVRRIADTHRTGDSRIPIFDLKKARTMYEQCRQGGTESIAEYKRNYDNALRVLVAAGGTPVPQELQAVDFMSGLDKRRFAQFIVDIENDVIAGIRTVPDTLAKMYTQVSGFKVVSTAGQIVQGSAYITTTKSTNKSSTHTEKEKEPITTTQSPPKTKTVKSPPTPCIHCGGDHWNSQCPNKESKQKTQPAATAANGVVRLSFSRTTLGATGVVLHSHKVEDEEQQHVDSVISIDTQANISIFRYHRILSASRRCKRDMFL